MVRWINLALALVLGALLVMELTRSEPTEAPGPEKVTLKTTVVREKPGRRARRLEAREEALRQERERARRPTGLIELDETGRPFRD
ncbi:MAG TPA: hypothetical protein VIB60_03305 [Methylomirabilota bacterium]